MLAAGAGATAFASVHTKHRYTLIDPAMETPTSVKVRGTKTSKAVLGPQAALSITVACVYDYDATGDDGSVASSGVTASSFNSNEFSAVTFEQDLDGFDLPGPDAAAARTVGTKWWGRAALAGDEGGGGMGGSDFDEEPRGFGSSGGGAGSFGSIVSAMGGRDSGSMLGRASGGRASGGRASGGIYSSLRGVPGHPSMSAPPMESMEEEPAGLRFSTYDDDVLVAALGKGKGDRYDDPPRPPSGGLGTLRGSGGGGGSMLSRLASAISGGGGGGGGGGGLSERAVKAERIKAEKTAVQTPVAELLRSIGLGDFVLPVVLDLGFDDLDVRAWRVVVVVVVVVIEVVASTNKSLCVCASPRSRSCTIRVCYGCGCCCACDQVLRSLRPHEFEALVRDAGLKPGQATKLRLKVGIARAPDPEAQERAARLEVASLVGRWIEVDGVGPGHVTAFEPVWNHLFFDSVHTVDFSASAASLPTSARFVLSKQRRDNIQNGLAEVKLLLRRRKLGKWNRGVFFEVIPDPVF